ncbi:MAG: DUF3842 family protein [Spirochaetaceae bacterium]|jgi:hypothetical protein|nr:DUF3842 family protein [Spirochaetaceae bacterium]
MKATIIIIDGMGGGIGVQLITKIRELAFRDAEIVALGANAVAAERMVKAGAHRGASGENAVRVMAKQGDFILGPVGIVIADSMMGEITGGMVRAVLDAPAERILLPLEQEHFYIAGLENLPLSGMLDRAVALLRERMTAGGFSTTPA